jgi:hypothetical protein
MKLNEFSKNAVTSLHAFKKIGSKFFGKESSLFRTASKAGTQEKQLIPKE